MGGGTAAAWSAVLGVSDEPLIGTGDWKGSEVLKKVLVVALSERGVGSGLLPWLLIVLFIAETGIFSRPDGDDAKPWPDEAEAGTPVARDKLGRPLSVASPLEPVAGVMTAVAGFVGDELMWRWEDICWSDGSRVIRGLIHQSGVS